MTRSSEQKRLLAQAVHSFIQYHPEHSVASVELKIADAVKLSQASVQKWRAGHSISEENIPVLAEWAICQAGMNQQWLHDFLHVCDYPVGDLEARLFGPPDTPALDDILARCQEANVRLWGREDLDVPEFYTPRLSLSTLLQAFLTSERPGLILVGASGLGKTSWIRWLANNNASGIDRPVLAYRAGRLDGSTSLPDLLARTLTVHSDQPSLPGSPLTWPLLIIFDGVNESPEMTRLAWQVDRALVNAHGLKVLMTFRPESFQIVRRGLALDDKAHCYFTDLDFDATDGLRADLPAIHLEPFLPHELPIAYDRYRQVYDLQTPFDSLHISLKSEIRHPLKLRQVAETYKNQLVPDEATGELIPSMLNKWFAEGRLLAADVHLVEDQLMPLMLCSGHWSNTVPVDKLRKAPTASDQSWTLGELGAFTRLADVGLLASTNGRLDEPIRFAHESYYEYFAQQHLCNLCANASDVHAFYADLATAPPFVYGPIRQMLVEEVSRRPDRWVLGLLSNLPETLAVGTLEDWCRIYPDHASARLARLWRISTPHSTLARLGLPIPDSSSRRQRRDTQRKIAAAAYNIVDIDLLGDILLTAEPAVQAAVADAVTALWRSDRESIQHLIKRIRQHVINRLGLPNLVAAQVFVQLLVLTLLDFGLQPDVSNFLWYRKV